MPDKPIHIAGWGPFNYPEDWIGETMDTDKCDCVTIKCRHNSPMDDLPTEGPMCPPDPFGPVVFINVVDMRLIGLAV